MSLRLAATTSTSSSFVSSSTPTATPVTPHADASSSFHVFRATESPPPSLSNGTYGISSRDSVPPPTPVFTEVDIANGEKIAAISSANGLVEVAKGKGKEKEKEKEKPCVTVDIDAAAEDARQRGRQKGRRDEEVEAMAQTAARFAARLAADYKAILEPDVETPFTDAQDAVRRLLPYHIFLHPKEDVQAILPSALSESQPGKGKRKATEEDLMREEIAETKFALECWRRKTALEKRFRRARVNTGKRLAADDQAYTLTHAALDSDRVEVTTLQAEYRNCKAELDRIAREKKAAAAPPAPALPVRTSYYPPPSSTISSASTRSSTPASTGPPSSQSAQTPNQSQSNYRAPYRAYSYPYQQPFQQYSYPTYTAANSAAAAAASSISNSSASASAFPTPSANPFVASSDSNSSNMQAPGLPTTPIPLQLPASSLVSLQALGIVPVAAENLPPADQPQPAAVLKGMTHNGTMVDLEIKLSALGAAQASGLAVLLGALAPRTMPTGVNGVPAGASLSTVSNGTTPNSAPLASSAPVAGAGRNGSDILSHNAG